VSVWSEEAGPILFSVKRQDGIPDKEKTKKRERNWNSIYLSRGGEKRDRHGRELPYRSVKSEKEERFFST